MSKEIKISSFEAIMMISVALMFDLLIAFLNLITVFTIGTAANFVLWPFIWLTFWFWFKMKGVNFINNRKRLISFVGLPIIEFIPALNSLPGWTLMVITTIGTIKAEKLLKAPTKKWPTNRKSS